MILVNETCHTETLKIAFSTGTPSFDAKMFLS